MGVWDRVQQRIDKGQYSFVTSIWLPGIIYISLITRYYLYFEVAFVVRAAQNRKSTCNQARGRRSIIANYKMNSQLSLYQRITSARKDFINQNRRRKKSLNEPMSDEVLPKSCSKLPLSHFLASLGCWEEPTALWTWRLLSVFILWDRQILQPPQKVCLTKLINKHWHR